MIERKILSFLKFFEESTCVFGCSSGLSKDTMNSDGVSYLGQLGKRKSFISADDKFVQ